MTLPILFEEKDQVRAQEQYAVQREIFYEPLGNEVTIFENAFKARQAVALIGPTGAGKSRFLEHMAQCHQRPYILIAGEETTDAASIVGSPYVIGNTSAFLPGPLFVACSIGAFVGLEEILEMRPDVLPALHALTDKRRKLVVNDINTVLEPREGFMLAISFNPGQAYQTAQKAFPKPSFIQRFTVIPFHYARGKKGTTILTRVSGVEQGIAERLVQIAEEVDKLHERNSFPNMRESIGYHALVKAAEQIKQGTRPFDACHSCLSLVLSSDSSVVTAVDDIARKIIGR